MDSDLYSEDEVTSIYAGDRIDRNIDDWRSGDRYDQDEALRRRMLMLSAT